MFPCKTINGDTVMIATKYAASDSELVHVAEDGTEYISRSVSGYDVLYPRFEQGLQPDSPELPDVEESSQSLSDEELAAIPDSDEEPVTGEVGTYDNPEPLTDLTTPADGDEDNSGTVEGLDDEAA